MRGNDTRSIQSRRSSASSMRPSMSGVYNRSAPAPSVSIVFADTEKSPSAPRGAAAATLSPRLNGKVGTNGKDRRKETGAGERGVGERMLSADGNSVEETMARTRTRTNSLMSMFSFRRSPSKQSLRVTDAQASLKLPLEGDRDSMDVDSTSADASVSGARQPETESFTIPFSESPKATPMDLADVEGLPRTLPLEAAADISLSVPPLQATPVPIPEKEDQRSIRSTASPSSSRGWFGSFSKAQTLSFLKNRDDLNLEMLPETDSSPEEGRAAEHENDTTSNSHVPPPAPVTNRETNITEVPEVLVPGPSTLHPLPSSKSIWFVPQPARRPSIEPVSSESGPSSADVKTPTLQDFPCDEQAQVKMEVVSNSKSCDDANGKGEVRMSDLNPSTSRFTLQMPLPYLGRPKVPLGEVREVLKKEAGETLVNVVAKDKEDADLNPSPSLSPSNLAATSSRSQSEMRSSSASWWSYAGFGISPNSSEAPSASTPATTEVSSGEQNIDTSVQVGREGKRGGEMDVDISQQPQPDSDVLESDTTIPTIAISSTQSQSQSQTLEGTSGEEGPRPNEMVTSLSNWYLPLPMPWSLYDWYAASAADSPANAQGANHDLGVTSAPEDRVKDASSISTAPHEEEAARDDVDTKEKEKKMTEAERIKEEALARPDNQTASTLSTSTSTVPVVNADHPESQSPSQCVTNDTQSPSTSAPPTPASKDMSTNPITSSLALHAKGWASFFSSSRSLSLAMRSITEMGEAGGDGMEVMDIDEGPERGDLSGRGRSKSTPPNLKASGDGEKLASPTTPPRKHKAPSISVTRETPVKDNDASKEPQPVDTIKEDGSEDTMSNPLTTSGEVKRKVSIGANLNNNKTTKRDVSPTPSKASSNKSVKSPRSGAQSPNPKTPKPPNLILPTFDDTFRTLPRSRAPPSRAANDAKDKDERKDNHGWGQGVTRSKIRRTLGMVSNVLFAREDGERSSNTNTSSSSQHSQTRSPTSPKTSSSPRGAESIQVFGSELPRAWEVINQSANMGEDVFGGKKYKKVVIIGIHGWFPGYAMRTVIGEPTGTSIKFANMMELAVKEFAEKHNIEFEEITKIPLDGEGKIVHRVEKLYQNLANNKDWMDALSAADVIFVATHSQGTIVSTHLIHKLLQNGHIRTGTHSGSSSETNKGASSDVMGMAVSASSGGVVGVEDTREQRVCCLALCGIHLGPLAYLHKNSFFMPYIQWFENEAATELFEFQNTESNVSKAYVEALRDVLNLGVKFVYIASMNDQVVPIYSGAFSSVSHPLILRALYIDGDAYHSSDFLSNLLVLLMRIRNAGLSDGGLLAHLSEATAGSLNGVGHSTAYEEPATFSLAVDYAFLADNGTGGPYDLEFEPFNALDALNDYEIPWALRDLIADERVLSLFSKEFLDLRDAFGDWHPRTTILRDLKRKLEPIRRLKLVSRL